MTSANLAGLLDGPARRLGDRPAVLVGDRVVRTWAGLGSAVARRAAGLRCRYAVAPDDRVVLAAANSAEYLELMFAVWHAGGVVVPIGSRLHAQEVAGLIADCAPRLCLVGPELAEPLARLVPDGPPLVVIGSAEERDLERAGPADPLPRAATDEAWIFYTSGTTGQPKGARLTHANLLATATAYVADVAPVGPTDSLIHVAALSHASGLFSLTFLGRGAAQVLPESGGFDATELGELVGLGQRASFFVPPVLLRRICVTPGWGAAADRLGTVLVGASPVHPAELATAVDLLGPRVWNGYGQGESPNTITALPAAELAAAAAAGDTQTLGSVGTARFATCVRVVDPTGRPAGPGEVGEVVVSGPTVMAGYLDRPEATAETLRGGWLHTGDLGRLDERGLLTLVDRAKDVIITGGYNVYPREVEDVLIADPGVAEVAVIGVPDPVWGERIEAFVVARPGAQLETSTLDTRCLGAIARHKRPRAYHLVDELPRNPAGKVRKSVLRDSLLDPAR